MAFINEQELLEIWGAAPSIVAAKHLV